MNSTITESKNTPKGTNSRITETEKWISELENRMVEITAEEPNKGKGMKRLEESLKRPLRTMVNAPIFELWGPRGRRKKRKAMRKVLNEL